jgi:RNA polymerase sigma-70 factor (ECF subfamily)
MNATAFPISRAPANAADETLGEALRGCAQHSPAALRRIHELTAPRFLGLLVQMLDDREQAEDLLQQCYLAIWEQAAAFNPARSRPHTWLLSRVRQLAIEHLRAQQFAQPDEVDAALRLTDAALGPHPSDPAGRRLLRLAFLAGRSPLEIAHALGEPPAAVRSSIHQALLALLDPAERVPGHGLAQEYVAGAYALGTLSPRARRRFESLLRHDIEARRCLQRWDERLVGLAPELPPVRLPDAAWSQIEARIVQAPPSRWMSPRRWALLAALVLGFAVVVVLTRGRG